MSNLRYITKKIGILIIMLLCLSFLTFVAFSVIPGDSAIAALGTQATEESIEILRESMGLNDPLPQRYLQWLGNVLKGDFNQSTQYKTPVKDLMKDKLPVTIWLAVLSSSLILLIGIPLGIAVSGKEEGAIQKITRFFTHICMSIPPFFLGMLLTLLFGVVLKWFTPGKYVDYRTDFVGFIKYLMYPALAIAIPKIAMVVQFLRSSIQRELELDYVRTAQSKGNKKGQVLFHHVVKNAMLPVITFLGLIIADVLAGSIIVEQVFNLPGIGRLLIVAIGNRDLFVVQTIVLYIVVVVVVVNFIVDIIYQSIDPRVRLG